MNGTELIAYLSSNVPSILSSVGTIIGSIITVVFLRSNTSTTEFEKIKAGKFDEVVEDLLSAGQMTYTEFYRAKNFLHIAKLIGRVCGAKRPHSVFEQPIYTMSM